MLCIVAVAICLSEGCQTVGTREAVARTFDYGQAYLPAESTNDGIWVKYRGALLSNRAFLSEETPDTYREFTGSWLEAAGERIRPGTRWPVVVFLHGCAGYGHISKPVAEMFLAAGAIIVLPNSLARPGRGAMCGGGAMAYRVVMRKQEARYAAEQLVTQPWVDRERIVLVGQSEGGQATAAYSGDEFAAHIITGINCRHNGGGVSAPADTPVLAIRGADDKLYDTLDNVGRCSVGHRGRGSASIIVPDEGHMVITSDEARAAIYTFLHECCDIGTGAASRGE